jgi:hypothetical protein
MPPETKEAKNHSPVSKWLRHRMQAVNMIHSVPEPVISASGFFEKHFESAKGIST